MKFLVIGLGSMGKRRVRCLLANKVSCKDIFGFDSKATRVQETVEKYAIQPVSDFDQFDFNQIDVVVISTPPDLHMHYAHLAAKRGKPMFIEAGVLEEGMQELIDMQKKQNLVIFPSCTMRYFPAPKKIKEILQDGVLGKVYVWQYQSGQYLPDWHPWENVKDFYVSNRITGGCREIVPFELEWLVDLFGEVRNLEARKEKMANIADIDDIYLLQCKHHGGIFGQLVVDVLSRPAVRYMRITAEKGMLIWDAGLNAISMFSAENNQWSKFSFDKGTIEKQYINPEEPYQDEIADFINCVKQGCQPKYTVEQDMLLLKLLYCAEQSDQQGKRINIQ